MPMMKLNLLSVLPILHFSVLFEIVRPNKVESPKRGVDGGQEVWNFIRFYVPVFI